MTERFALRLPVALFAGCVAGMAGAAHLRAAWPVFVAAAFGAGVLLVLLWRQGALTTRQVLVGAVLFRLFFLPLGPGLSADGYRYVWDGLVQLGGVNPYRYAPEDPALAARRGEAVYDDLNSASFYSVYPPIPQAIFAFGVLFYGAGWQASYFVIKGVLMVLELGGVFVLARLVSARALVLYAWHPLVLLEVAGQPHTEAALVLFLALTLLAARRGRGRWASAALAGAVWTKLFPAVLFPYLWRRFGWKAVWPAVLVSAALALPYAAPYVPGHLRTSLDLYVRYFEFNAGPYYAVKKAFTLATGADWSKTLGPFFRTLFLLVLPALYVLDARRGWRLAQAFLVTWGAYLFLSTTVHPWYLLAVLPLAALLGRPAWHWQWLGVLSLGTYLFYIGGPYWVFVILGWGGWLLLVCWAHRDGFLQSVQRGRAQRKFERLHPFFPRQEAPLRVLDLGAGEGYVGAAVQAQLGADVTLADVLPMNRTPLPHVRYDGTTLPLEDNTFDVVMLYFVLHHAADAEQVLREALRVTRGRVLVAESVVEKGKPHRLLTALDAGANRLRSGGAMREQKAHFRTAAAWKAMAERLRAEVVDEKRRGRWVHRQAFFALEKKESKSLR